VEFSIKSGSPEKQRGSCVVVGVFEPGKLTSPAALLDKASNGFIAKIIQRGDMEGKPGSTLLLHDVPGVLSERILLVGLGKEKDFRDKEFTSALRSTFKKLNEISLPDATLYLTELAVKKRSVAWCVRQAASIALDTTYKFEQFKTQKSEPHRQLEKLRIGIERRRELAEATRPGARHRDRGRYGAGQKPRQPPAQYLPPQLPGRASPSYGCRIQAGMQRS
jgi:leucyl aminopeptidase